MSRRIALAFTLALAASPPAAAHWPLPPADTGNLFISNFDSDKVVVMDETGVPVNEFGAAGLDGPRGVVAQETLDGKEILVASELSSEIYVFNAGGVFKRKFTDGALAGPTGMATGPNGNLYVSSWGTDEVVVFDSDENFVTTISGGGLDGPNCVAFDSDDNIYVSSALDGTVKKFDASGDFLLSFTGGGLASPMSIARSASDVLYVSSGAGSRVVKFDTGGAEVGIVEHPDMSSPQGIAFDDNGHWWCSMAFSDLVLEFDENDQHVQTLALAGLDFPRSMAFLPNPGTSSAGDPGPVRVARVVPFPEPATGGVGIALRLAREARVDVDILDAAGRRVRRLVSGGTLPPGSSIVSWDGRDGAGRAARSGVYFCRLVVDGRADHGRITLIR